MSVQEFCKWSGLRRAVVSTEIAAGTLQTVKSGRTRLILYGDAVNWYLARRERQMHTDGSATTLSMESAIASPETLSEVGNDQLN